MNIIIEPLILHFSIFGDRILVGILSELFNDVIKFVDFKRQFHQY